MNSLPEDPSNLDFKKLKLDTETAIARAKLVVGESRLLRMQARKLRAALDQPVDGLGSIDGHSVKALAPGTPVEGQSQSFDQLSKRERQVLALIVAGKSSKQIAAELGISFKTAVTHRASIMSKMEVHEIASVVREAIRRGLA